MSAKLGRNARLLKSGQPIGYGKNISVKASAEMIKDYSMDSLTPAVSGAGKQSFTWTMERLYTNGENMSVIAGWNTIRLDLCSERESAWHELRDMEQLHDSELRAHCWRSWRPTREA